MMKVVQRGGDRHAKAADTETVITIVKQLELEFGSVCMRYRIYL